MPHSYVNCYHASCPCTRFWPCEMPVDIPLGKGDVADRRVDHHPEVLRVLRARGVLRDEVAVDHGGEVEGGRHAEGLDRSLAGGEQPEGGADGGDADAHELEEDRVDRLAVRAPGLQHLVGRKVRKEAVEGAPASVHLAREGLIERAALEERVRHNRADEKVEILDRPLLTWPSRRSGRPGPTGS